MPLFQHNAAVRAIRAEVDATPLVLPFTAYNTKDFISLNSSPVRHVYKRAYLAPFIQSSSPLWSF
jgi:hypothetical protein